MPEALAIVIVMFVSVVIYVACWFHVRNPANFNPAAEVERAKIHHAWLTQRLELARRENWEREMIADLTAELRRADGELAKLTAFAAKNQACV